MRGKKRELEVKEYKSIQKQFLREYSREVVPGAFTLFILNHAPGTNEGEQPGQHVCARQLAEEFLRTFPKAPVPRRQARACEKKSISSWKDIPSYITFYFLFSLKRKQ